MHAAKHSELASSEIFLICFTGAHNTNFYIIFSLVFCDEARDEMGRRINMYRSKEKGHCIQA